MDGVTITDPSEGEFSYSGSILPSFSSHIRFFTLSPSTSTTSALKCRLTPVAVDTLPAFKALSYTWGPPEKEHNLFIEAPHIESESMKSVQSFRSFQITASLDCALRHLRHDQEDLVLWIDQICIDQTNNEEKDEQVLLMSTIYARADEVLIWLGPAGDDSDKIMDAWQAVGEAARSWGLETYLTRERLPILWSMMTLPDEADKGELAEKARALHTLCRDSATCFLGKTEPSSLAALQDEEGAERQIDLGVLKAMLAWYRREWFTRVWVMQEYALNKTPIFVCGDKHVEARLVVLARQIFDYVPTLQVLFPAIESIPSSQDKQAVVSGLLSDAVQPFALAHARHHKYLEGTNPGNSLLDLLRRLYVDDKDVVFKATNPRDRVYGLLGLAVDARELGIKPNYSDSLGSIDAAVAAAYANATRAIIQKTSPHVPDEYLLDILSLAQHPKNVTTELEKALPSWAPDFWHIKPPFCDRLITPVRPPPFFCAAGPSRKPHILVTTDDRVLGLEGVVVDEIIAVGEPWLGTPRRSEWQAYQTYFNDVSECCEMSAKAMQSRPEAGNAGLDPVYPTGGARRREEAFWRVLIGDIELTADDQSPQRATEPTCEAVRQFAESNDLMRRLQDVALISSTPQTEVAEWSAELKARFTEPRFSQGKTLDSRLQSMAKKRPFVTKIGYVGMAPWVGQVGDIIVVLFGAEVPFVVRPAAGFPDMYYRLLGEAYCDGIMDGEVLSREDARSDVFYLV